MEFEVDFLCLNSWRFEMDFEVVIDVVFLCFFGDFGVCDVEFSIIWLLVVKFIEFVRFF